MDTFVNGINISRDKDCTAVFFCNKLYEKEVLFSAAYNFTADYVVQLEEQDRNFKVIFSSKKIADISIPQEDLFEFVNQVLDEQLRLQLERKTAKLREIIVEHAFRPLENLKERIFS